MKKTVKEGGRYSGNLASALLSHIFFSVYIRTPVCTSQTLFLCGPNFTRRRQQVRQTLSDSGPNGLSGEGVQSFRGEGLVRQLFRLKFTFTDRYGWQSGLGFFKLRCDLHSERTRISCAGVHNGSRHHSSQGNEVRVGFSDVKGDPLDDGDIAESMRRFVPVHIRALYIWCVIRMESRFSAGDVFIWVHLPVQMKDSVTHGADLHIFSFTLWLGGENGRQTGL